MKTILILTAMPEELQPMIDYFKPEEIKVENSLYPVYQIKASSKLKKYNYLFASTGIGKVNAAFSTTNYILQFKPELIINMGTAGGVDPDIKILDLVVGEQLAYHDVDVTGFGYEIGQVPNQELYYPTTINEKITTILQELKYPYHIGTILSGDQFINDKNKSIQIANNFDKTLAVEMESTAIVDICNKLKTKVVVIRGISDQAHNNSSIEFDQYLKEVSNKFISIIEKFMEKNELE